MSSRNFRRLAEQNAPPAPPDDSDEDYEPLCARHPDNSRYEGLVVSSDSESDSQSESERESELSDEEKLDTAGTVPDAHANKKKHLKKKDKGKGRKEEDDMDEIDRSVKEVNALLGAPPPAPDAEVETVPIALILLTVNPKHLNVANEIRRRFGPDHNENRRSRAVQNPALLLRRVIVHPNKETQLYEFNNTGLSMSKYKNEKKRMYFVYNHSEEYQKMHRAFLAKRATQPKYQLLMYLDDARKNMHVEALMEISDYCFSSEENDVGNEILENVVTFLQYVAHQLFIVSQNHVRLDYKFLENRVFHVAMLKYVYLLTNKACHRTALEIAKMLLLLDPNDPMEILRILDVLALRAREHEWLIDAIKYFERQREAKLLFNIAYSNALAHFHVAQKKKLPLDEATNALRDAILAHPKVLLKIFEACKVTRANLVTHEIFKPDRVTSYTESVEELYTIYVKMTGTRWNEPNVLNWLIKTSSELCVEYHKDHGIKDTADSWVVFRTLGRVLGSTPYLRHMSVLSSIAKLILDAPLTSFRKPTCAWDPLFDNSINRYNYIYKPPAPRPRHVGVGRIHSFSNTFGNDNLYVLNQLLSQMHTGQFTHRPAVGPPARNFQATEPPAADHQAAEPPAANYQAAEVPAADRQAEEPPAADHQALHHSAANNSAANNLAANNLAANNLAANNSGAYASDFAGYNFALAYDSDADAPPPVLFPPTMRYPASPYHYMPGLPPNNIGIAGPTFEGLYVAPPLGGLLPTAPLFIPQPYTDVMFGNAMEMIFNNFNIPRANTYNVPMNGLNIPPDNGINVPTAHGRIVPPTRGHNVPPTRGHILPQTQNIPRAYGYNMPPVRVHNMPPIYANVVAPLAPIEFAPLWPQATESIARVYERDDEEDDDYDHDDDDDDLDKEYDYDDDAKNFALYDKQMAEAMEDATPNLNDD